MNRSKARVSPVRRRAVATVLSVAAVMFGTPVTVPEAVAGTPWPEATSGAGMAFHPRSGSLVMFGGTGDPQSGGPMIEDTWTWNGSTWFQKAPATSPPPRRAPSMATATNDSVLLFGGEDDNGLALADTWTWGGKPATWTRQSPTVSPPPRADAAMAPDGLGNVLLFGGRTVNVFSGVVQMDDTWLWDGVARAWTQQAPAVRPPDLAFASMAYDKNAKKVVLFGGSGQRPGSPRQSNQTWTWDPTTRNWTQETPIASPPGRTHASMAYDGPRAKVVLFGGLGTTDLDDTWSWDGQAKTWTEENPAVSPRSRRSAMMAYHPPSQKVVLHGGWFTNSPVKLDDTWTWNGLTLNWKKRGPS